MFQGHLTPTDAARHLNVTTATIGNYIARGLLPAVNVQGRWFIPADAVSTFCRRGPGRPKRK